MLSQSLKSLLKNLKSKSNPTSEEKKWIEDLEKLDTTPISESLTEFKEKGYRMSGNQDSCPTCQRPW